MRDVIGLVAKGAVAKEAVETVLAKMIAADVDAENAARQAGVLGEGGAAGAEEGARAFIRALVEERKEFVLQRGEAAHGPLMGPVMKEWRGKVDGQRLADMLREEITSLLTKK